MIRLFCKYKKFKTNIIKYTQSSEFQYFAFHVVYNGTRTSFCQSSLFKYFVLTFGTLLLLHLYNLSQPSISFTQYYNLTVASTASSVHRSSSSTSSARHSCCPPALLLTLQQKTIRGDMEGCLCGGCLLSWMNHLMMK